MSSLGQFGAFVLASILFIQVPGPSLLFTIGRALTVGRRDALLSVLGNSIGLFVQILGVAVGLGALVRTSALAFTILKTIGAVYVIYLGITSIRKRSAARSVLEQKVDATPTSPFEAVRIGALVGLTNPKTIVFFAAFLPQFIDGSGPAGLQILVLGLVFCLLACTSDAIWAMAAARARRWFATDPKRLDKLGAVGGLMMITLGVTLLTVGSAEA